MIGTTSNHLPKKALNAMVYVEMNLIPPLEMGSKIGRRTKGAFRHSKKFRPKSLSKTCMNVKLKKVKYCQKLKKD
jgi:hypothetical protein